MKHYFLIFFNKSLKTSLFPGISIITGDDIRTFLRINGLIFEYNCVLLLHFIEIPEMNSSHFEDVARDRYHCQLFACKNVNAMYLFTERRLTFTRKVKLHIFLFFFLRCMLPAIFDTRYTDLFNR